MSNKLGRLQTEGEKKMTKHISEISYVESNQPSTEAVWIQVGKDFNLYNYKTSEFSMKLANCLAVGRPVILIKGTESVTVRLEDEDKVLEYQLQQLEYLLSKYATIKAGFYANLAWAKFSKLNPNELDKTQLRIEGDKAKAKAKAYFKSEAWTSKKIYKLNALEPLLAPLTAMESEVKLLSLQIAEQRRMVALWNQAAKARVFKKDWERELPNQQVSTPIQLDPTLEVKIGLQGPYAGTSGKYITTEADKVEAAIVNTWYYNQPEFRVPTLDEQIAELEELREWFQTFKDVVRFGNAKVTKEAAEMYERLEFLEYEVGPYVNPVDPARLA